MKKRKERREKNFIFIIILGLLSIFVFLWLYLKEKQYDKIVYSQAEINSPKKEISQESGVRVAEPTKDWGNCKNIKAGYQVKYPSDWEMGLRGPYGFEPRMECNIENINFGKYDKGSGFDYYIKIVSSDTENTEAVYKNSNSLEDYFKKRPGITENSPIIETFVLDNEKAVYLEKSPNPRVYTFHDRRIFDISGKNISQETFDDFLSTFEFLN